MCDASVPRSLAGPAFLWDSSEFPCSPFSPTSVWISTALGDSKEYKRSPRPREMFPRVMRLGQISFDVPLQDEIQGFRTKSCDTSEGQGLSISVRVGAKKKQIHSMMGDPTQPSRVLASI